MLWIMSISLPNQPTMYCITFINVFNHRLNIPLYWCMNEKVMSPARTCTPIIRSHLWLYQIFYTFLQYYYVAPRLSSNHDADLAIRKILQWKEYTLSRQWTSLHDDPWRIPWQAGEVVSMNALCKRDKRDGDEYCIRCGLYNSLNDGRNWEGEGRIEW